jgi:hypothetical protein
MFNDKLLEYRENGDLERLSRQVALPFPNSASLFGLQNISELCIIAICQKASAQVDKLQRLVRIPNSALLFGLSAISCL